MEIWDRLEAVSDRWNVLRHPFYVRWSDGELTPDELALYAGQYAHAVTALAKATRHAANAAPPEAEPEPAAHAAEEAAHVDLWWHFGDAVGAERAAAPETETAECAGAWADA